MNKSKINLKELLWWCLLFNISDSFGAHGVPDPRKTKIWGPGLEPHKIVMPARYFFIEAVDKYDNRISADIGDDFEVTVEGGTGKQKKPCRIWTNILNRKDGSLIVRYKVYEVCTYLIVNVKYKNKQAGESPYIINQHVYPEGCRLKKENIADLLKTWQCGAVPSQMAKDFQAFPTIDWDAMRYKVIKQFDKPHAVSLCHYIIKDNKVYRKCYGKYVGFSMFSDNILSSLTRKAILPDLEFFVNLGDWPLSTKDLPEKFPIFSWCGSTNAYDIVMPTYEITESALENMGRVMLDMLSVQGNVEEKWENRQPKLFWRGRDSNRHRLDLISLSRKHPELFNVSLTNFFFYRDEEDVYGPKSEHISFFKFFDYKYQLAIDGTVATYRMPFLLGGGSLVFKPSSKYYEHFYSDLKPNIHYVPVKADLSDLIDKIEWAKSHDEKAKLIAQNGQKFVNENLLPQHIFCYYFHLLHQLSQIMTNKITVLEDMELINQKEETNCDALDLRSSKRDEL